MIKQLLSKARKNRYQVDIERIELDNEKEISSDILKIMNILNYTKKSAVSYSAGEFNSGYHSFEIDNHHFKGQRNPKMRLENVPLSFDGLTVLDLGCNQGGMLYAISDKIKNGIGVDYDSRMINAANKIKSHSKLNNLDYFVFNLETENLDYIKDFIPAKKVDVVFLLSICKWIKNWKEVIMFTSTISDKLLFETNGSDAEQEAQIKQLEKVFSSVELINEKSDDDPSQKRRMLYLCSN